MSEATTLIVTAMPNSSEPEAMQSYLKGVLPLLMGAGGKVIKRVKVSEVVNGDQPFGMVLVMDFDSKAKVKAMFASDDYKALLVDRDRGFASINIALSSSL